ncbi:MAG TPA: lactonase family protein [Verrucomicrobiae bacterium]|nr:lactonase family protein [Verrucomicrobiae bacterium]
MKRNKLIGIFAAAVMAILHASAAPQQELVFVGSGRANIEAFHFDLASGALTRIGLAARISHPSYFAIAPNHRFLYSITEGHKATDSSVSAFAINPADGELTLVNSQPAGGAGPCYIEVNSNGKDALIANYASGSVAVFRLGETGALSPMSAFVQDQGSSVNPDRQEGPHAHCIVTDPTDRFAFVCDLGVDKIMSFKFDPSEGSLRPNDPAFVTTKPGAGPRHIVFHPNGRWAYVIDEMGSAIVGYSYDSATGALHEIQSESTLTKDFSGNNTGAELAVLPNGKFVFFSNRGDDSVVVFACNPDTGRLTFVERVSSGGKIPRQFEIDPTGSYLLAANQDSNTIVVFRIDGETGHLQRVGDAVSTDNPMCVKFMPPN